MLTDADHVWHAMYFKHPNERARYIKSQIPHADAEHLLRKYNKFPKIYRDDLVEFAVIVNGKVIDTVQKRQEAHDLDQQQEGYVIVADVPKSESRNPQYDRYYQEIIKTPLVPSKEEEDIQVEQPSVETTEEQTTTTTTEPVQVEVEQKPSVETTEEQTTTTTTTEPVQVEQPSVETTEEQTTTTTTTTTTTEPVQVEVEQQPSVETTEQPIDEPVQVEVEQQNV